MESQLGAASWAGGWIWATSPGPLVFGPPAERPRASLPLPRASPRSSCRVTSAAPARPRVRRFPWRRRAGRRVVAGEDGSPAAAAVPAAGDHLPAHGVVPFRATGRPAPGRVVPGPGGGRDATAAPCADVGPSRPGPAWSGSGRGVVLAGL